MVHGALHHLLEGALLGLGHATDLEADSAGRLLIPPQLREYGQFEKKLVMIAYEVEKETYTPVTVHTTTRQQINYRLTIGRFIHG